MQFIIYLILISTIFPCPEEPNCLKCSRTKANRICQKCEESIFDPINVSCNSKNHPIKNCKIYKEQEPPECDQCAFGFGLADSDSNCVLCQVKDCAVCNEDPLSCKGCYGSKGVQINGEDVSCVDDPGFLTTNCFYNLKKIGENQDKCMYCQKGFTLNSESLCVSDQIENCWLVIDGVCDTCKYGFYETEIGLCKPNSTFFGLVLMIIKFVIVLAIIVWGFTAIYSWKDKKIQEKRLKESFMQIHA